MMDAWRRDSQCIFEKKYAAIGQSANRDLHAICNYRRALLCGSAVTTAARIVVWVLARNGTATTAVSLHIGISMQSATTATHCCVDQR